MTSCRIESDRYIIYIDENGLDHREDGPSIVKKDGSLEFWHHHGYLHRLDGPAMRDGPRIAWYYYGKQIKCSSQQEFEKLIKLKGFW